MSWTIPDDSVSLQKGKRADANLIGMTTVPLPTLSSRPPSPGQESSDQKTEFQGLIFVSLSNDTSPEKMEGEDQETKPHSLSDERVGAIQIFRDTCKSQHHLKAPSLTMIGRTGDEENCRTRLEACRIENREFELAEGFKELGNDHADSTKTWDWVSFTDYGIRIS
jgi:hypothetical protein